MTYRSVRAHGLGGPRNGLPPPGGYLSGQSRLTPTQREAALRRLVADRNITLRQARADRLVTAWHRDVPRTCTCDWTLAAGAAFVITRPDPDCPSHSAPRPEPPSEPEAAQRRAALLEANPGGVFRPGDPRIRGRRP